MAPRIVTRLFVVLFGAVLLYSLYFVWQGWEATLEALAGFPWLWLPVILLLVSTNFVIRELKWDLFRRWAGIAAPRRGSALTFYSGLSMTISPGRVGELIKPLMLKQFFGVRVRRGVPLVFCERLTDLFGMNLLTILTFTPFALKMASQRGDASVAEKFGMGAIMIFFIAQLVFMVLVVALVRRRKFVGGILLRLRHPRLRKAAKGLLHMYLSCYDLLTLARLGKATLIASASWFFECVAGWLICLGLGLATPESLFSVSAPGVSLWDVTFIFCIASIAGGLSTLPGGLGGFELVTDQLLKMLLFGGVMAATLFPDPESAYGAIGAFMVILRAFTLFYAVLLGFAFIGITTRAYHHAIDWTEIERSRQAH